MKTFEIMLLIISVFSLFITLAMFIIFSKKIDRLSREKTSVEAFNEELQRQMGSNRQEINESVQNSVTSLGTSILNTQERTAQLEDKRIAELISQLVSRQELLQSSLNERLTQLDRRFVSFQSQSEEKLENIRSSVEVKLNSIQESNSKKLDEMRATVDEKLQKTLNERLAQSFSQVSDRLEQVYKGLGEMQTLAIGVGDLKKVLSNVKTRGILGEIQLGAILEQILSPEQYAVNVATKKGS
ncbi:MAG: DNA recombination protein RmuC, partial [Oscillospiraceae bacterium]